MLFVFFFSSRRRHTRCALVTGVQTCALPIFGIGARPPPLHPPELERARRRGRAVISGEVGDDLIGLAMAQRPRHPADGLEGEAVAHRAVALHLDRLDAHAIGFDPVAIRAFELLAEIITAAETRCYARDRSEEHT